MAGVKNELGINERDLTGETKESKAKTESDFKELFNSLKEISNKFEAGVDKIRQTVEEIANYIKNGNLANKKNTRKLSDTIERTSDTDARMPIERFSVVPGDTEKTILGRIEDLLKTCCRGGGGIGGGGGGGIPGAPSRSWVGMLVDFLKDFETSLLSLPELFPKTIGDMLFNPFAMATEINQFNVDMKRAIHQTQGLTAESGYILENFTKISKSVHKTGFNEVEFEKQLVKYARSGIKSSKDMQKIAVAQLNTERQLGLAAGSLHETFLDLSIAGNMTTEQIGFANKSMIDVARNTGITGDKLRDVVQSSQAFTRSLRNSGNLTTMSMKNVMQMSASFKKFGVEDAGSEMQKYLTDGTKLLLDGGDAMATIMRQAADSGGVYEELLTGTMTKSEKSMSKFSKGFSNVLEEMGLTSMEQFEKLSAEEKMILNLQAVSRTGKQAGELLMMKKALEESTKTFDQKMADIKKEKAKAGLTPKEKAALEEKESSLKTSKGLDILATISESFKGAKNFQEGASAFGTKRKTEGLDSDIAALQGLSPEAYKKLNFTNKDIMKNVMANSLIEINKGLDARGEKTLDITPDMLDDVLKKAEGGDTSALRETIEKIQSANQILATEKQEGLDPSTKILHDINKESSEMRQTMREILGIVKIIAFGETGELPDAAKDALKIANDQLRNALKMATDEIERLRRAGERADRDPNLRGGPPKPGDPIDHFQVGTNRITENGLAYLHEGEIVVPKEFNQIAKGNGPFNMSEMTLEMPPNRPIYSNALAHANRGKASPESMFTNPIAHMKDRTAKPEEMYTNLIAHMKDATSSPDNSFKRTGLQTEELLSLKKDLLNRYSDNNEGSRSNLLNRYSDNDPNEGPQMLFNRRVGNVPYSPENQLITTNERTKAQMATMPSDKFGTSVVQEKNSAEMVSILREISDRLKNMSSSAPAGGMIDEYGSRNYSKVDPRLSNMMGGSYTKSDAIKAIY